MTQIPAPTGSSSPPPPQTTTTRNQPRSASPESSYYAMSEDEEGGYSTVTHTESGRGVKLLYSKSKVYIHPTPSAKDNIAGFVALLQQKPARRDSHSASLDSASLNPSSADLLLSWLPEASLGDAASVYVKVDLNEEGDSPPRQTYLVPPPPTITAHQGSVGHYAFAIPVSAIYSLLVRPPSLGWWFGSVIINTRAGDSFPALFFHDSECMSTILQKKKRARENFDPFGEAGGMFWGGDEVLRWLRRYVHIERSGAEPNIYLVEPTKEDSEAFSGKLTTSSVSAIGQRDSMTAGDRRKTGQTPTAGAAAGSLSRRQASAGSSRDASMDPFMKFVKETGWNIMEKFSKVTTFTRNAAQNVLDDPRVPPQMRRLLRNPEVQTIQEEFDSARIYLARWAMGMAEQSDRDRSQRIWTAHDIMELEDTDVGEFELLDSSTGLSLEERRKKVTIKEWSSFFDARTGRLSVTVDEVKERVFHGGLDPDDGVRKEAWLFLLGVHDWYSTTDERKAQAASLRDQYVKLKGVWWERLVDLGGQGEEGEWWREQRGRIEKDVHRTDRNVLLFAGENIPHPDPDSPFADVGTNAHMEQLKDLLLTYNEYNRELGYVQGMSDLLAPIYAVVQDDALAFWAFVHFMKRMERNFLRDQSGMRAQLLALDHLVQFMDPKLYEHLRQADSTNFFFFFRMLLVWYKREFEWLDVLRLWEGLWTDYLSSSFHLFIALAILEKHRDVIMMHLEHFDEVLKYVNELSGTMDLESTLVRAESLFRRFQRLVEAVDKQHNFPAPRLRMAGSSPSAATKSGNVTSALSEETEMTSMTDNTQRASSPGGEAASKDSASTPTPGRSHAAAGKAPENSTVAASELMPKESDVSSPRRIITPDLRGLLNRTIYVVPKSASSESVLWGNARK
ncbi:GTPase activating protein [Sporothrix epigloea]|uniref:GTPase activating protein n=1 Tax=Sporothrix epigloea TaxID=1892477 RepID=A0ABP0DK22_9PEZI